MYEKCGKRIFDVTASLIAAVFLFLPMCIISILVLLDVGSPVFFRQKRIGKDSREFNLLKYRTMRNTRDKNNKLYPDKERLTKLGKILRKTSVDELPNLFNVIAGSMSIVGPRPLPVRYLSRYTSEQLRRHETLPGITGISVIMGRNLLSWDETFRLDTWYVDHISLKTDIGIILRTIIAVLNRKGSASGDDDVRSEFLGTYSVEKVMASAGSDYIRLQKESNSAPKIQIADIIDRLKADGEYIGEAGCPEGDISGFSNLCCYQAGTISFLAENCSYEKAFRTDTNGQISLILTSQNEPYNDTFQCQITVKNPHHAFFSIMECFNKQQSERLGFDCS